MQGFLSDFINRISGEWRLNLETQVPREELYRIRIASSKPSLGFFVLLICSAVIATLGLLSNSTAVVIGAMIVAPLMDPILSLAFGLTISDNKLVKRSAITVAIGVAVVVITAWILTSMIGPAEVNREITSRTAPTLIDLGIATAAAVAGAFTITRDRLSNSIAGVAIAVALVPPLCVTGIGLSLGQGIVAVFMLGQPASYKEGGCLVEACGMPVMMPWEGQLMVAHAKRLDGYEAVMNIGFGKSGRVVEIDSPS